MDSDRAGSGGAWGAGRAHLVGLDGREMAGLAQILALGGREVSASVADRADPSLGTLRRAGVRFHSGHASFASARSAHLLVHGPEIGVEAPERLASTRQEIPQYSIGEALERIVQGGVGVAVAGSREASSAAAMVGWILAHAGYDPTIVLGASALQLGGWGRLGLGPHRVVEAVEERGDLAPRSPEIALILDGGLPGHDAMRSARIRRYAATVGPNGLVLGLGSDAATVRGLVGHGKAVELLSMARGCTWWGADLRERGGRFRFRAFRRGRFVVEVWLRVPGRRAVLPALAAVAVCGRLGVSTASIREGLEEFEGLARGLASRGSYRGVTLLDDAASDPSAVAQALADCRRIVGSRRLWSVFRPASPRAWAGQASAFAAADLVTVVEPAPGLSGREPGAWPLVRALADLGIRSRGAIDLDGVVADLDRHLEPGDVLLTLGGADVGTIADALSSRRLAGDRQGR